jgi:transcriptional regulator with XRE-family HTH domain
MTNIRKLLAENIKTGRSELGLSQAKLAELANTGTQYIAMIEGAKKFPSPEMIERIAAALKKDTLALFTLTPLQDMTKWKEVILADFGDVIQKHFLELNSNLKITENDTGSDYLMRVHK